MRLLRCALAAVSCCALFGGLSAARFVAAAPGVLPPPSAAQLVIPEMEKSLPAGPELSPSVMPTPSAAAAPAVEGQPPPQAGDGELAAVLAGRSTRTYGWWHPSFWVGPDPWNAGVEVGINGSQGINDVFSLRAGGHIKRSTQRWKLDSSIVYNKNLANSVETQNNAKLDARLDRILAATPWTLFSLNNFIYDEFQAYDLQASLNGGIGYQVFKTKLVDLMTRFGAGATREFGGPDDEWKPNALLGVDYTHKITATQSVAAKVDYFPEWADFGNYRVVSDLGWVIDLDSPKNISLKLSLIDRYDSTPNGVKPNSFDYAVLLIWGL